MWLTDIAGVAVTDLTTTPTSGIVVTGTDNAGAIHTLVYDRFGQQQWSAQTTGPGTATPTAIDHDIVGNIVVTGSVSGTVNLPGGPLTATSTPDLFVARWTH